MSKSKAALDHAATIIAAALNIAKVERTPIAPDDGEENGDKVRLVAALSADGAPNETGFCMGASEPHEFEHLAALELIAAGGDAEHQAAVIAAAVEAAGAAIAADHTLGGRVDFAELAEPESEMAERYVAIAASLRLTYTAPTALG